MKKKSLFTNIFRTIIKSKGRFISIFFIVMLGSGFFCGIRLTSSAMIYTADNYFNDTNLMDLKYISTIGFDNSDITELRNSDIVENVQAGYSEDLIYNNGEKNLMARVISISENQDINKLVLTEGRMPENSSECVIIDRDFTEDNENKVIDFSENNDGAMLNQKSLTVVGSVKDSAYISNNLGKSQKGRGEVDDIIYVKQESFSSDFFTEMYVTLNNTNGASGFSDEYKENIKNSGENLFGILEANQKVKYENIVSALKMMPKQMQIAIPEPKLYEFNRDNNPEYTGFGDNANRIDAISKVFPLFFILVALLVSMTTFTRMISEERKEAGILKAIGYTDKEVSYKFFIYSVTASFFGGLVGVIIGGQLFPKLIYQAYQSLYNTPPVDIPDYTGLAVYCIAIYVVFAIVSVWIALKNTRKQCSAELMRPEPPKSGKRVFVEKFPAIWNKLNFSQKVTIRNISRYKKRFIITSVGIAGCTALILAGFGIQDSLSSIVDLQYNELFTYDSMVIEKENLNDKQKQEIYADLENNEIYEKSISVFQKTGSIYNGEKAEDINIVVTNNSEEFSDFTTLRNRQSKEEFKIPENGAIISEKMAMMLGVDVGDNVLVSLTDDVKKDVVISEITENYAFHYLYLDDKTFENTFSEKPDYGTHLVKLSSNDKAQEEIFSENIMTNKNILAVSMVSSMREIILDTVDTLDIIVLVLIVSAGILAFVVLYNLNNINVNERIRELATIKVLGFQPKAYIYKESMISTIFGILVGLFFGTILHIFIIKTAEVDMLMFGRDILPMSFIYAVAITLVFTFVINIILHIKLKKINMVEALKSVE